MQIEGLAVPLLERKQTVSIRRAKTDPACDGVCALADDAAVEDALARMELTDLWGVAGRLAARLRNLGVADPLALKHADPRFIRERLGVVVERLVLELRGIPCLALERITPIARASRPRAPSAGR